MTERFLGLAITIFHTLWVVFMLTGFFWTLLAFFFHKRFFDFFWFRTLHAAGILLVSLFPLLGRYCPLTIWENLLRQKSGSGYEGGFILHYLEKFIYPDIDPSAIRIGTFVVAFVSIAAYILRPPERTKSWFKKISGSGIRGSGTL
ncbi:MAG: DUF2784 domain-containing protein [candidate division Zixibacteria bacterium]|nr:DUF2784 domain-containing protein [candidate division Zixibacteria bacterium]